MEVAKVHALTIDVATGQTLHQTAVTGFNNWGEITRVFMFDAARTLFYYVEANFTAPRPAGGRPITLSRVDPKTGQTTVCCGGSCMLIA